jgi:hypothetical protein
MQATTTAKPPQEMSPRERRQYQKQVKKKAESNRMRKDSIRRNKQLSLLDEMNSELEQQERQLMFPGFVETDLEVIDQLQQERLFNKGRKAKPKAKLQTPELFDDVDSKSDPDLDPDANSDADPDADPDAESNQPQKLDRIEWYEQECKAKLADPLFWADFEAATLTVKVEVLHGIVFPLVREKFKSLEIDAFWETLVGRVEFELLGGSALMQPNIEKAFAAIESFAKDVRSMRQVGVDSSIYELGLGPRLESQLEKADVHFVEQLIDMTEEQVAGIKNVGKDSMIRIKKRLAVFGLKLKRSLHEEMGEKSSKLKSR